MPTNSDILIIPPSTNYPTFSTTSAACEAKLVLVEYLAQIPAACSVVFSHLTYGMYGSSIDGGTFSEAVVAVGTLGTAGTYNGHVNLSLAGGLSVGGAATFVGPLLDFADDTGGDLSNYTFTGGVFHIAGYPTTWMAACVAANIIRTHTIAGVAGGYVAPVVGEVVRSADGGHAYGASGGYGTATLPAASNVLVAGGQYGIAGTSRTGVATQEGGGGVAGIIGLPPD